METISIPQGWSIENYEITKLTNSRQLTLAFTYNLKRYLIFKSDIDKECLNVDNGSSIIVPDKGYIYHVITYMSTLYLFQYDFINNEFIVYKHDEVCKIFIKNKKTYKLSGIDSLGEKDKVIFKVFEFRRKLYLFLHISIGNRWVIWEFDPTTMIFQSQPSIGSFSRFFNNLTIVSLNTLLSQVYIFTLSDSDHIMHKYSLDLYSGRNFRANEIFFGTTSTYDEFDPQMVEKPILWRTYTIFSSDNRSYLIGFTTTKEYIIYQLDHPSCNIKKEIIKKEVIEDYDKIFYLPTTSRYIYLFNHSKRLIRPADVGFLFSYKQQEAFSVKSWMKDLYSYICDTEFRYIKIPSTHNSGIITHFLNGPQCQNLTIQEQLEIGVRSFDIRICVDKNKNNFYIQHNGYYDTNKQNLFTVLKQIVSFAQSNKGEFIVLDIRQSGGCEIPKDVFDSLNNLFTSCIPYSLIFRNIDENNKIWNKGRGKFKDIINVNSPIMINLVNNFEDFFKIYNNGYYWNIDPKGTWNKECYSWKNPVLSVDMQLKSIEKNIKNELDLQCYKIGKENDPNVKSDVFYIDAYFYNIKVNNKETSCMAKKMFSTIIDELNESQYKVVNHVKYDYITVFDTIGVICMNIGYKASMIYGDSGTLLVTKKVL